MIKSLFLLLFVVYTPDTVPTESGTYPVVITQEDSNGKVETEIYMTVTEENTVINENIAIDAKDFTVSRDIFLTEENIIKFSNAKVWDIETLEEYEIYEVKLFKIDENNYEAEIYAFEELNTLIHIEVVDDYYQTIIIPEPEYNLDTGEESIYMYSTILFQIIIISTYILFFLLVSYSNKKIKKEFNKISSIFTNVKKNKH